LNNAELLGHKSLEFASFALGVLGDLNQLATKDDEKRAERSFKINKGLAIVDAIMSTAQGVSKALGSSPPPFNFINAGAVSLAGAAQIATVKRQQFQAGGTGGNPPPTPSRSFSEPAPTTPQLDLGFLGGGAGQTGFRTYVVSSEVSNAQQANQRINDQATLVG